MHVNTLRKYISVYICIYIYIYMHVNTYVSICIYIRTLCVYIKELYVYDTCTYANMLNAQARDRLPEIYVYM